MKNIFTLLVLGFALSLNAQLIDSLQTTIKPVQSFKADFDGYKYVSQFKNVIQPKSNLAISSFNKTTQLNDVYVLNNVSTVYLKSNLILENQYRGFKIDSFNPYGVGDVRYAMVLGVVNSLLNKK